jgi:hypothetical protein
MSEKAKATATTKAKAPPGEKTKTFAGPRVSCNADTVIDRKLPVTDGKLPGGRDFDFLNLSHPLSKKRGD